MGSFCVVGISPYANCIATYLAGVVARKPPASPCHLVDVWELFVSFFIVHPRIPYHTRQTVLWRQLELLRRTK